MPDPMPQASKARQEGVMSDTEEIFSIFKKNAGLLGKGHGIYPTSARLECL